MPGSTDLTMGGRSLEDGDAVARLAHGNGSRESTEATANDEDMT